jgi:uncharacterized protein YbjT (DUF2867 family)
MTTLVIGARGAVGRHVLCHLLALGEPVRASVRDLATAGDLTPGVPVVAADLTRPETLAAALDGVRQVSTYATSRGAEAFAAAARAVGVGVEHVVLMSSGSVLLPWTTHNAIAREHREVEDVLGAAGPRLTPVRPLVLATNALGWVRAIRADGVVALAHPDGRTAPVHERDIAAVAAAALTGTGGDAVSDILTGPGLLSQREQAEILGDTLGRAVTVEEISAGEARTKLGRHLPPPVADAVVEFLADAARGGSPVTDTVERVLGRAPLSFREWARTHVLEGSL